MKALITGITGQSGSYMADLLLEKDYEVHGLIRRVSTSNTANIQHLEGKITLHFGDLSDSDTLHKIVKEVMPDEVYNFGAMSQVRISYDLPLFTGDITGLGFARVLEAVRAIKPDTKVYQAGSSEMFGKVQTIPQNELTPFYPRYPYGCAKAYAFYLGRAYREGYNMKIYNGICFNHESPRRGDEFLSKKVVKAVVKIKNGLQDELKLGNLEAKRDWGYAKEYVYWIWKMMQGDPDDFVISTEQTHSVKEFVEEAFNYVGLNWEDYVVFDETLQRPAEVDLLIGDSTKAKKLLEYKVKTTFKDLIKLMIDEEMSHV